MCVGTRWRACVQRMCLCVVVWYDVRVCARVCGVVQCARAWVLVCVRALACVRAAGVYDVCVRGGTACVRAVGVPRCTFATQGLGFANILRCSWRWTPARACVHAVMRVRARAPLGVWVLVRACVLCVRSRVRVCSVRVCLWMAGWV